MGAPKTSDEKGRLTLGSEFANRDFIVITQPNGDILLRPAVTVAANEAWLLQNSKALNLVGKGLEEARAGKFVKSPVRASDSSWLDDIEE